MEPLKRCYQCGCLYKEGGLEGKVAFTNETRGGGISQQVVSRDFCSEKCYDDWCKEHSDDK